MSVPPAASFYCDSPTARGGEKGKEKDSMRPEYFFSKSTSSSKQKSKWTGVQQGKTCCGKEQQGSGSSSK